MTHANAPLTPTGRQRLVDAVVHDGWTYRRAAERFQVSVATVARWIRRHRDDPSDDRPVVPPAPPPQPHTPAYRTPRGETPAHPPVGARAYRLAPGTERMNRETHWGTDVVGIFPGRDAVVPLVSALPAEQHNDWIQQKRYMPLTSLEQTKALIIANVLDAS